MILCRFIWMGSLGCLLLASCVKARVYRSELKARVSSEGRETVLKQEIVTRREEQAQLIGQLGELNRLLGEQDLKIRTLQDELASRAHINDLSSSKLLAEKAALEKELATQNKLLEERTALLQKTQTVQEERLKMLTQLHTTLTETYSKQGDTTISIVRNSETIEIILPDKGLFQRNSVNISAAGKQLLAPLALLLSTNPTLDMDVIANTENILPKEQKQLDDTWAWSLLRATNLVRLLVREYNVNPNQLNPVGHGEFYPVQSNETPEGRQKNRRTQIVLRPQLLPWPVGEPMENRR